MTGQLPCGCHIDRNRIVFCEHHANVQKMAAMLDALRKYFIETTGEESPFVKRIDTLVPRRS